MNTKISCEYQNILWIPGFPVYTRIFCLYQNFLCLPGFPVFTRISCVYQNFLCIPGFPVFTRISCVFEDFLCIPGYFASLILLLDIQIVCMYTLNLIQGFVKPCINQAGRRDLQVSMPQVAAHPSPFLPSQDPTLEEDSSVSDSIWIRTETKKWVLLILVLFLNYIRNPIYIKVTLYIIYRNWWVYRTSLDTLNSVGLTFRRFLEFRGFL